MLLAKTLQSKYKDEKLIISKKILFFCGEENFQFCSQLYFSGVVMYSENIANLSL